MAEIKLQDKIYYYNAFTDNNKELRPDDGYDALSQVTLLSKYKLCTTEFRTEEILNSNQLAFSLYDVDIAAVDLFNKLIDGNADIKMSSDDVALIESDTEWHLVQAAEFSNCESTEKNLIITLAQQNGLGTASFDNVLKFISSSKAAPEKTYVAYFASVSGKTTEEEMPFYFIGASDRGGADPYDEIHKYPGAADELTWLEKIETIFGYCNNKIMITYLI